MKKTELMRADRELRRKAEAYKAKRDALSRLPVTREERAVWEEACHRVWQAIGYDVIDAWRLSDVRPTTSLLVEAVVDLGCFEMYADLTKEECLMFMVAYQRPSQRRWLASVLRSHVP